MKNIIIKTIQTGAFIGVAFLASTSTAFAAPMLTPASVSDVTSTSATIVSHVSNPFKNSTVWFEFYNNSGSPTTLATQGIWHDGTFEWHVSNLNPGQTYSYRAGAMEGGVTVYTPMSTFTTPSSVNTTATTVYQSGVTQNTPAGSGSTQGAMVSTTNANTNTNVSSNTKTTQNTISTNSKKQTNTSSVAVVDGFTNGGKTVAPAKIADGFTNGVSATVIGANGGMLPSTLIGWTLLIIAMLVAILVGHMIYESTERRKRAPVGAEAHA